jgi:hypothetical protein
MIGKEDWKFRDDLYKPDNGDTVPIEVLTGPYKNVIFRYVRIGVSEKENGEAVLRFQYELLDVGSYTETTLRSDYRFTEHIGTILNHFLLEISETDVADRENDHQELDEERTVYEKGSAISQG